MSTSFTASSPSVAVIGGTGFLGAYVVQALVRSGMRVRVIARNVACQSAMALKPLGDVGQVSLHRGDIHDTTTLHNLVNGCDAVINLVGILYESGRQRFYSTHCEAPENLASMLRHKNIRYIHMSALGVDKATSSAYARSKYKGEQAVLREHPEAIILRPSIIYGAGDSFFSRFAQMMRLTHVVPLIGGGKTRFQPVYAANVADAIVALIRNPGYNGQIIELGGDEVYSWRELMQQLAGIIGVECMMLPVPFFMAKLMGMGASLLPTPPLTSDQVELLRYDNVLSTQHPGLHALGITPACVKDIVPHYIVHHRKHTSASVQA